MTPRIIWPVSHNASQSKKQYVLPYEKITNRTDRNSGDKQGLLQARCGDDVGMEGRAS